jgi:single-strand DNA-binding protein
MANETTLTICGNTTGPAELRYTPSGAAVANFTVASTPRTFDKNANEWKDGTTLFMRCSVWREQAENVAETLDQKGMRVIVVGRLTQREYEKDGQKRTVVELEVDDVAPSLKYATAKVNRTQRSNNQQQGGAGQAGGQWGGGQQAQQDPWGAPQGQQDAGQWGNGPSNPPF